MANWEHRSVVTEGGRDLDAVLARESSNGWELVSAVAAQWAGSEYANGQRAFEYRLFFKRPR